MIADRSLRLQAQSLYTTGMTVREISASLKVSRSTIGRWIGEVITDELRLQARSKIRGPYRRTQAPKPLPPPLSEQEQIAEFLRTKGITKITPLDIARRLDHHLATGEPLYLTQRKRPHANR